ncbi:hypothetical protein [Streptomyces purpurascens]|uniref:hypothetical protein n=1 Tax=Streptomyces purpurascens TaxID=1924 RepID=UPI0016778286|nr:hypothetical protein [Streptomyces purpurascens]MCE7050021.1 hypothetical protein [Streptomyces purpurascens]GHA49411.1 hypothetical protein GCM10010303_70960 [Streptomyces purpurascens]
MKIQERTGAGAGRSAAPAQPSVGDRLPTPPRERKPALAALAVLLILVGALGATMLVLQAGDRIEVVKVTQPIPAGGSVNTSNAESVMVAEDAAIHYIKWTQLPEMQKQKLKAVSAIPAGAVLVGEMFGDEAGVEAGKATVGLSLKAGQYPTGLKQGDTVAAYRVTADAGTGSNSNSNSGSSSAAGNAVIVDQARVTYVPGAKSSGDELVGSTNLAVTLTVDSDKAADLAQAASNSEVALVLVSGN